MNAARGLGQTDALSDRDAIRDLVDRYAYYADTFQLDKLMELWAEDGVFDETAAGNGCHTGRPAIRNFFDFLRESVSGMAHFVTSQVIEEISDSAAKGVVFSYVQGLAKDGTTTEACIYYKDDYLNTKGRWVFKSRVIVMLLPIKILPPKSAVAGR